MTEENRNTLWAGSLVEELARQGLLHVCVAPGSRCAPLVLAFANDDRFTLHPHFDERSAAYFALGLGKASGIPAAVVTTSGTAAANAFPAVVEASQGETPLLLLTADRPGNLRGLDANQTIDQVRLYGGYVRDFHDVALPAVEDLRLRQLRGLVARAVTATLAPVPGPVHLNLQFDKPLERQPVPGDIPAGFGLDAKLAASGRPEQQPFTAVRRPTVAPGAELLEALARRLSDARRGLLVCGPVGNQASVGASVVELARATRTPLIADPLSGARFTPGASYCAVVGYDAFLGGAGERERFRPDLIIRFGASPTSASALAFLESCGASQIVIDSGGRWKDHLATAEEYVVADPAAVASGLAGRVVPSTDDRWAGLWSEASDVAARVLEAELGAEFFEGAAVAEVCRILPDDATLFIGNSMPIRDLDAFGRPRDGTIHVVGHRGASGIDGNVSSAIGVAVASSRPTVAVLGDLALLHDVNGLASVSRERPDLTLVVINNDGGGIFHMLPIRDFEDVFEPYVAMPHGLNLERLARAYQVPYERVESISELRTALANTDTASGPRLLEVPFRRSASHQRRGEILGAVQRAVFDRMTG